VNLVDLLKQDEGAVKIGGRHTVYRDSLGLDTIGYGRLVSRGLSEDEAQYLLENDIRDAEKLADKYPWFGNLDEVRQAVIVSLLFNIGPTRFAGFVNTIAALSVGDWVAASNGLLDSKWAGQVGARAKRLATMMLTGNWP
jgi:lysozyme